MWTEQQSYIISNISSHHFVFSTILLSQKYAMLWQSVILLEVLNLSEQHMQLHQMSMILLIKFYHFIFWCNWVLTWLDRCCSTTSGARQPKRGCAEHVSQKNQPANSFQVTAPIQNHNLPLHYRIANLSRYAERSGGSQTEIQEEEKKNDFEDV